MIHHLADLKMEGKMNTYQRICPNETITQMLTHKGQLGQCIGADRNGKIVNVYLMLEECEK